MIIQCINCNKKFHIDPNLIPTIGRQIQCGSCDHTWYFKLETKIKEPVIDIEQIIPQSKKQKKLDIYDDQNYKQTNIKKEPDIYDDRKHEQKKIINKKIIVNSKNKIKTLGACNFLSYLIVVIISLMALIILVDTIKSPLIEIFPSLENILFNLFETLKDIKLFIIDLT